MNEITEIGVCSLLIHPEKSHYPAAMTFLNGYNDIADTCYVA